MTYVMPNLAFIFKLAHTKSHISYCIKNIGALKESKKNIIGMKGEHAQCMMNFYC